MEYAIVVSMIASIGRRYLDSLGIVLVLGFLFSMFITAAWLGIFYVISGFIVFIVIGNLLKGSALL